MKSLFSTLTIMAVLLAAFVPAAAAGENKVAATVTGENYCLHCTLVMADKPDAECGPETCSYALKVKEAKDADGEVIAELTGATLHYINGDAAKTLRTDSAHFGKQVEVKGTVFIAERAIDVAEATLVADAGSGDDFSDFDDFDFSVGGNKASARR
jgi:hypothetical protein